MDQDKQISNLFSKARAEEPRVSYSDAIEHFEQGLSAIEVPQSVQTDVVPANNYPEFINVLIKNIKLNSIFMITSISTAIGIAIFAIAPFKPATTSVDTKKNDPIEIVKEDPVKLNAIKEAVLDLNLETDTENAIVTSENESNTATEIVLSEDVQTSSEEAAETFSTRENTQTVEVDELNKGQQVIKSKTDSPQELERPESISQIPIQNQLTIDSESSPNVVVLKSTNYDKLRKELLDNLMDDKLIQSRNEIHTLKYLEDWVVLNDKIIPDDFEQKYLGILGAYEVDSSDDSHIQIDKNTIAVGVNNATGFTGIVQKKGKQLKINKLNGYFNVNGIAFELKEKPSTRFVGKQDPELSTILNVMFDNDLSHEILEQFADSTYKPLIVLSNSYFPNDFTFTCKGQTVSMYDGDWDDLNHDDNNVAKVMSYEQSNKKAKIEFHMNFKRYRITVKKNEEGWRLVKLGRKGKGDTYFYNTF